MSRTDTAATSPRRALRRWLTRLPHTGRWAGDGRPGGALAPSAVRRRDPDLWSPF